MFIPSVIQTSFDSIVPLLTTAVIAPHGMTDLIHAENNNKIMQLFRINILCVASSMLFQMINLDTITNVLFSTSSAIHFRHDFPVKNEFLKLCISSFLVLNAQKIGMEMFILYMCFIHVPNHYTIYKNMIKENFSKSFAYIMICAIVITFYFYSNENIVYDENVFTISKALIISHIVYEELYTKNDTIVSLNMLD